MSSIQTPTSATELSEAKRMRIITSRPEKSAMSTRTSWKVRAWFDHARRPPIGLPKFVLMVELYPFRRNRFRLAGTVPCAARMSVQVVPPSSEYSRTWPSNVFSVS